MVGCMGDWVGLERGKVVGWVFTLVVSAVFWGGIVAITVVPAAILADPVPWLPETIALQETMTNSRSATVPQPIRQPFVLRRFFGGVGEDGIWPGCG